MSTSNLATNIPGDVFALICRELVAGDSLFEAPALLTRSLGMVCSTWSDLIGVDAFLWSHIDVSLSWRGVWTLADWERHLRYQFAAHKRHSRGVELHLQCEENDLPWVQPYLRDMALRWASIRLEGASWCRPYLTEHRYCDAAPPLSFPTLREMTFRARSIDEGSNLDILKCGPAVRRLAIWLERWQTTPVVALRLPLPVSPGLTSLLLDVFGGARLDTSGVCVALQQCSATLETLDISTDTTLNPSKPIALPRLLRLYVHDKACSLLQVLRTERLMTLCIEEKSESDNSLTLTSFRAPSAQMAKPWENENLLRVGRLTRI